MRFFSVKNIGTTIGAAVAASALLAGVAHADPACPSREVSLYFEKGQTSFNEFSQAVVERVATEAKSCGVVHVVADAPQGTLEAPRAQSIASAFKDMGVKVLLVSAPPISTRRGEATESVLDRGATVRLLVTPALS